MNYQQSYGSPGGERLMSLCNCFDDNWVLIAIIILMLIFLCGNNDCGCSRNTDCGCGC